MNESETAVERGYSKYVSNEGNAGYVEEGRVGWEYRKGREGVPYLGEAGVEEVISSRM